MGEGFFAKSEGALLKGVNILTEKDPEKILWETLPDGEAGLKTPPGGGPISEEQSYCVLSDGSLYSVYRTIDGHPACSYSRDGGHTWSVPAYKAYADGSLIKSPRASNFAWRCNNGNYLYWFYNHGGKWYDDRNPVWVCGGVEQSGPYGNIIAWTQPEILLYEDDIHFQMGYPDLIEDNGRLYITETNKTKGRVHEINARFLEKLWNQFEISSVEKEGLFLNKTAGGGTLTEAEMPVLHKFTESDWTRPDYGVMDHRSGFTLEMVVKIESIDATVLFDTRREDGVGVCVETTENGSIGIIMSDGRSENHWYTEPDLLKCGVEHHIGIVVDGGPKIIFFVIDGKFCDGGDFKQFGWGRFNRFMYDVNGLKIAKLVPKGGAAIKTL
jgi:hypothetical protein